MSSAERPTRLPRRRALATLGSALLAPALAADAGVVRVVSTTDRPAAQALLEAFERAHPGLRVDYREMDSMALDADASALGGPAVDVLWSSAMDRQIKLVNDGRAARYASVHAAALPRWAVWRQEAYASTFEPACMVIHRDRLAAAPVSTHAELLALLKDPRSKLRGKVASYDIERAGLGFLFAVWDSMVWPRTPELWRALGENAVRLYPQTQGMLDALALGEVDVAYNVLGAYAEVFARRHPRFAVIYPTDFTLLASRVAFISRDAPNPDGARKWLDFLLSQPGQRALAAGGALYPVRADVMPAQDSLEQRLGRAARPIALGPGLMVHLDQQKRRGFIKRWRQALGQT